MYTRVKSAVLGILLLALIIKTGGWAFTASVCLLNFVALWELNGAFKRIDINTALVKSTVLAGFLQFTANITNAMLVPLFIILTIIALFLHNIVKDSQNNISDAIFTVFAFVYTSLPFMYWIYIRNLPQGIILIWWVFVSTWSCDTGAFFIGCWLGKNKLAPNISPNKTVEGSVGGLIFSTLGSIAFARALLPMISIKEAALLGIIIGTVAQVGDLSASLLKRYCHIKDFSNIIPGHGGILDRFDSALFSFPVAYYYIIMLMQKGGL